MEIDPNSKITRPAEPELDLYTIPSHSSWFAWDDIHETERVALKEFFDGTSITRTPKIYKEYRDFIINKYREDSSRRLTFTEVRKSLVGDVCLLHKVFRFLERWGLINFSAPKAADDLAVDDVDKCKVKVEEGAPSGVRVAASPSSLRPISAPPSFRARQGDASESGCKQPPLTSYSDVFGDLMKAKPVVCGNCGEACGSECYEHTNSGLKICVKCFKSGNYGEGSSGDDFKFGNNAGSDSPSQAVWTETETLLLLESVLKHGDDWEVVAQSVPTKSKLECISKLIELPFAELIMGSSHEIDNGSATTEVANGSKQVESSPSEIQGESKTEEQGIRQNNNIEENGNAEVEEPPSKRKCVASPSDAGDSLMRQVALMANAVGPHVTAAAAGAAVAALCNEASCPTEIFHDDCAIANGHASVDPSREPERAQKDTDSGWKEKPSQPETPNGSENDDLPLGLRIRSAVATALGSAAAHAKLLAEQEEREIETLVATIIEAQIEKLQCKVKHFDELELIMDKEHAEMEDLKEHILSERIDILQSAFAAGIPKRWDHTFVKP